MDYTSGSNVIGKLVITYEDTTNNKFTESPFYIHGNLLATGNNDDNTQILRKGMQDRVFRAMEQMSSLGNNSYNSAKVTYDFDLVVPE